MEALDYIESRFPKVAERCSLTTGRIMAELAAGGMLALMLSRGDRFVGFILYSVKRPTLWIHAMFVEPGEPRSVMDDANEKIARRARLGGCSVVAAETTREGWGRRLQALGWNSTKVYRLEASV